MRKKGSGQRTKRGHATEHLQSSPLKALVTKESGPLQGKPVVDFKDLSNK